jgi:hypothetical protein
VATVPGLIASLDQLIDYFNKRKLDLPDGLIDRKTQFVINGAPFETLLSATPNDPLVLMLARGPAGYRFTAKALQHAVPDAKVAPSAPLPQQVEAASLGAGRVSIRLHLSGTLRESADRVNADVTLHLRLNGAGSVDVAEATIDDGVLSQIREARLRP